MRIKDNLSKPLLYEEVVYELYGIIDRDGIQPGSKFPCERELAESLGISRNVLREAFHVLESRGIVVSKQGAGRYLRALPKSETLPEKYANMSKNLERYSLLEAYEVRQVLEVKAVQLIVRNATDADIADLQHGYEKLRRQFEATQSTNGEFALHLLYAKKAGSAFLEQTLKMVFANIRDMMRTTFYEVLVIHSPERSLTAHRQLIAALAARDAELAARLMYDHIQDTIDMLQ